MKEIWILPSCCISAHLIFMFIFLQFMQRWRSGTTPTSSWSQELAIHLPIHSAFCWVGLSHCWQAVFISRQLVFETASMPLEGQWEALRSLCCLQSTAGAPRGPQQSKHKINFEALWEIYHRLQVTDFPVSQRRHFPITCVIAASRGIFKHLWFHRTGTRGAA